MSKIIFITGVSSGFGKDLLVEAAKEGHTIIGTVRREEQLQEINNIIPGKTFGYLLDVNDHEKVKEIIADVVNKFGR
ncbi:MAG: SDR family NAD(P)-dependent oxidoreductase, partial [Bacteroidota bacterium]|nr:SDR family NAD(P)-dependent oxidoreductase [Bacteroidota bacterium]